MKPEALYSPVGNSSLRRQLGLAFWVLLTGTVILLDSGANAASGRITPDSAKDESSANSISSPLISFDWADSPAQGFAYFTDMNTDHGDMGGGDNGLHGYRLVNGMLELWAREGRNGTSWHGRWVSLAGTATESDLLLNLPDPMPLAILEPYRVKVSEVCVRVKGSGSWKLEFKGEDQKSHQSFRHYTGSRYYIQTASRDDIETVNFKISHFKEPLKMLNLVVDSSTVPGSHLFFDQIDLVSDLPEVLSNDLLKYGFVTSYGRLLSAMNIDGTTKDHLSYPAGHFDSVPAIGFQIYAAAAAYDLGVISIESAKSIAINSLDALLRIPKHTGSNLLPHFLRKGSHHPDSEWSSVDTALATVAAALGLKSLGMDSELLQLYSQIVDPIKFDFFTTAGGSLSHGFDRDGELSKNVWTEWNSELITLLIFRALQDHNAPPAKVVVNQEFFCGRDFLYDMAALWSDKFASSVDRDGHGVDWGKRRRDHFAKQKSISGSPLWFGLGPVEIVRWEDARTAYLEGGVGTENPHCDTVTTLPDFGHAPWFAPHYAVGLAASLDPNSAAEQISRLRDMGLFPPLNGPVESVQVRIPEGDVIRWHRGQTSLNLFFTVAGLYAAICERDGRRNTLHEAAKLDGRMRTAIETVFKGGSSVVESYR